MKAAELDKSQMAELLRLSGCNKIQEAICVAHEHGIDLTDLDEASLRNAVEVMASAKSVGGQAAPKIGIK